MPIQLEMWAETGSQGLMAGLLVNTRQGSSQVAVTECGGLASRHVADDATRDRKGSWCASCRVIAGRDAMATSLSQTATGDGGVMAVGTANARRTLRVAKGRGGWHHARKRLGLTA